MLLCGPAALLAVAFHGPARRAWQHEQSAGPGESHGRQPAPLNDHLSIFSNNFFNFYNIINIIILKL